MIKLLFSLWCLFFSVAWGDEYAAGSDFAKSLMDGVHGNIASSKGGEIPGFAGVPNQNFNDAETLEREKERAMDTNEAGSFIKEAAVTRQSFVFSDEDPMLEAAEHAVENPLESVAKEFSGEVVNERQVRTSIHTCEQSGEPYLISCKYLLKPSPYYREKSSEFYIEIF